jgi:hypothetical protein
MCDERERLIGFVYDECEADERREVERHLEACGVCRQEISALRRVRQDLLAWEVPDHESVWRPFVAPPVVASWRQIPIWILATAAGVMFAVGAAGGVATHVVLSRGVGAPVQARQEAPVPTLASTQATPASVSATDLAALEDRIYARMRDTEQRVQLMSTHVAQQATVQTVSNGPSTADLMEQVRALAELQSFQTNFNSKVVNDFSDLATRTKNIERIGYTASPAGK